MPKLLDRQNQPCVLLVLNEAPPAAVPRGRPTTAAPFGISFRVDLVLDVDIDLQRLLVDGSSTEITHGAVATYLVSWRSSGGSARLTHQP